MKNKLIFIRNQEGASPVTHLSKIAKGESLISSIKDALSFFSIPEPDTEELRKIAEKENEFISFNHRTDIYTVCVMDCETYPKTKEAWQSVKDLVEENLFLIEKHLQDDLTNQETDKTTQS